MLFIAQPLDFVGWLEQYLAELHGHTKPLVIMLQKVKDRVELKYKPNSSAKDWLSEGGKPDGEALVALSRAPTSEIPFCRDPLPITPEVKAGVENCYHCLNPEQILWLKDALQGNINLRLLDTGLLPGKLGRAGLFTTGDCKEEVRVICGPLPPGAHHPDWMKKSGAHNASSSSDAMADETPSEIFETMIVTNKPLPKPSRKKKRQDRDSDDGNHSVCLPA
jgi:hypothetical protein